MVRREVAWYALGRSAQRNSTMNATRGSCATLHEIRGRVHLWSMWSIAQWRLLPHWLDHYARLGVVPAQTRILLDTHDGADGRNPHARLIAFGAMGMTGVFMALMLYTMHQSLKGMHAQDRDAHRNDDYV